MRVGAASVSAPRDNERSRRLCRNAVKEVAPVALQTRSRSGGGVDTAKIGGSYNSASPGRRSPPSGSIAVADGMSPTIDGGIPQTDSPSPRQRSLEMSSATRGESPRRAATASEAGCSSSERQAWPVRQHAREKSAAARAAQQGRRPAGDGGRSSAVEPVAPSCPAATPASRRAATRAKAGGFTWFRFAQASFCLFVKQQQSRQQVSASAQPQAQCWQGNGVAPGFLALIAGSGTPIDATATAMQASQPMIRRFQRNVVPRLAASSRFRAKAQAANRAGGNATRQYTRRTGRKEIRRATPSFSPPGKENSGANRAGSPRCRLFTLDGRRPSCDGGPPAKPGLPVRPTRTSPARESPRPRSSSRRLPDRDRCPRR